MYRDRTITTMDRNLFDKLADSISAQSDLQKWELFYEFICSSYRLPFEKRISVSNLYIYLKDNEVELRKDMVKVYAHGMYLLAKAEGKEIYGEAFNA